MVEMQAIRSNLQPPHKLCAAATYAVSAIHKNDSGACFGSRVQKHERQMPQNAGPFCNKAIRVRTRVLIEYVYVQVYGTRVPYGTVYVRTMVRTGTSETAKP